MACFIFANVKSGFDGGFQDLFLSTYSSTLGHSEVGGASATLYLLEAHRVREGESKYITRFSVSNGATIKP